MSRGGQAGRAGQGRAGQDRAEQSRVEKQAECVAEKEVAVLLVATTVRQVQCGY